MTEVKTSTGFQCELQEERLDDMELLDLLTDLESGEKPSAYRKILQKLIPEDVERLYDHVRTEDGRVPITRISEELGSIFGCVKNAKK